MTAAKHEGADSWRNNLIVSASGIPKPLLANAMIALRDSATWHGVLSFDAFAQQTMLENEPPWDLSDRTWDPRPWTPQDDLLLTNWLQQRDVGVNVATAAQAVEAVARDRSFHPVLEYLGSLEHDGTARTSNWLATYLGAEPSRYNEHIGRAMLIGAVARIHNPGCKVDTVPIFEGPQGARKSTAIKALFDPWFTDELADLGSKDAAMQTRGVWGVEISELDAMSRGEVSKIKAFISRTTDRFRPPYGNRIIESPRSCVFWGSTNADGYLKDETGGRRFWPVKVGRIDIDGLLEVRDQLWAEAVVLYEANVPWWITKNEVLKDAESQQAARYVGDPWETAIERYASNETEVTVEKVLRDGLGIELTRCGQIEANRVARSLRSLGFVRVQRRTGDKRWWAYRRLVTSGDDNAPAGNVTRFQVVTGDQVVTLEMPAGQPEAPVSPVSSVRS
jgi:predicted P-loop ATPase